MVTIIIIIILAFQVLCFAARSEMGRLIRASSFQSFISRNAALILRFARITS
jgi:hypothetical protein